MKPDSTGTEGEVQPASWEALGLAKSLGTASAIVIGSGEAIASVVRSAFEYGADEVLLADDPALLDYRAEVYASTLTAIASGAAPDLILFPTPTRTRELAGMSAMDLNSGVLADITGMEMDGDKMVAIRPIYEGKLLEKAVCTARPQFVTLRARAFPKPAGGLVFVPGTAPGRC